MENFEIPEDLTYTEKIRKFEPTDPAHADLLNMTVQALVNNITFLKRVLGKQGVDIQGQLQQQYEQLTGYTDTKIGELINGAPETLDTIKEVADAILENKNVAEALNEAVGKKLNKEGDASDTTVAFTSEDDENPAAWATMRKIVSGKLKDVLGSVSLMAKNLRYLRKLLGASDISKLADGTVTGALSKLNTDLQHQDISEEAVMEGGMFAKVYIESGIVMVHGSIPAAAEGFSGTLLTMPEKYAPRFRVCGSVSYTFSTVDNGKVAAVIAEPNGKVVFYVEHLLEYAAPFTLLYPLKRS